MADILFWKNVGRSRLSSFHSKRKLKKKTFWGHECYARSYDVLLTCLLHSHISPLFPDVPTFASWLSALSPFLQFLRFSAIVFSDCLTASSLFCLCTAIKAPTWNLLYFLTLGPHSAMVLRGHGQDLGYWELCPFWCLSKSLKRLFKRCFDSSCKAEPTFPHLHWQNIRHLQDPSRVFVGVVWEFLLTNCCIFFYLFTLNI